MQQTEIKKQLRYFTFPQDVKVRKNKVDQKNFVKLLKQHKKYSNKVIAEKLNVPETMVAHWFREDVHSSIPDPALWFKLKELLGIKTDEYDKSITEFEEREGTYEKRERCYLADFIAPTITTECKDEKIIVKEKKMEKTNEKKEEFNVVVIGQMDNSQDHTFESANRVYDKNQLCPTIPTCAGGNIQPKIIEESHSVEIKQATKEGSIKCKVGGCYDASYPDSTTPRGRVQEGGDVTPTLTASNSENIHYVETQYRIRKLTPKECWRLMGYTDEDYEKAAAVNSNTQLYKQAGNAIVKQVLMAIFRQMIPETCRQK